MWVVKITLKIICIAYRTDNGALVSIRLVHPSPLTLSSFKLSLAFHQFYRFIQYIDVAVTCDFTEESRVILSLTFSFEMVSKILQFSATRVFIRDFTFPVDFARHGLWVPCIEHSIPFIMPLCGDDIPQVLNCFISSRISRIEILVTSAIRLLRLIC